MFFCLIIQAASYLTIAAPIIAVAFCVGTLVIEHREGK